MSQVFEKATLKSLELKNHLVVAPMTRASGEQDGRPNELMADYYERFAKGGFPLIISEGVYPDEKYSQGYQYQPGIANEEQQTEWATIVERVKEADGAMICQLMHAGGQVQYNRFVEHPVAPSKVKPKGEPLDIYGKTDGWKKPTPMEDRDFDQIMNGFVGAAKRAEAAGFAGVELHAANGYLLNQLLSTHFNERNDQWGGELHNRMRFIELLVKAVRDAVSDDFLVGIRLGQITVTDPDYQWPEGEEGFTRLLEALIEQGLDYVHTTDVAVTRQSLKDSDKSLAQVAFEVTGKHEGVKLIINGEITEDNADQVAGTFEGALLAIGKKALANPDFADRLKSGEDINDLDPAMITPKATIQNELNWRKINQSD